MDYNISVTITKAEENKANTYSASCTAQIIFLPDYEMPMHLKRAACLDALQIMLQEKGEDLTEKDVKNKIEDFITYRCKIEVKNLVVKKLGNNEPEPDNE